METLTLINDSTIFEAFNVKEKIYSNGFTKIKKYSFDIIKGRCTKNNIHNGNSTDSQLEKYLKKRIKERREKIVDISLCNSWEYFVTLTFDPNNKEYFPNGYDYSQATNLMKKWLNNQKHKNKHMRYIIVQEFMKESGLVHFHGLFSCINWDLSIATNPNKHFEPIIINGSQIYNLEDYDFGFSTVSIIKDTSKVSHYISKYITKDLITLHNKKVFWHSRNLSIPKLEFKYINDSLINHLTNSNLLFYKSYDHLNSYIEVATMTK